MVKDVTVCLVYRPPSGGQDSITNLTNLIKTVEGKTVLIGDFNFPEINWETGRTAGRTREFVEATEDKMLEQLVEFSTHTRGNKLDLLLTNIPERILNVEDAGRLGHSDHVMILATLAISGAPAANASMQKNWARANWPAMEQNLREWNWRLDLEGLNASLAWEKLRDRLLALVEEHVPV